MANAAEPADGESWCHRLQRAYAPEKFDPASVNSYVRRPDPWHSPPRPYMDRIVYTVIKDGAARSAALKARQIDGLDARDKLEGEEFKSYGADMVVERYLNFAYNFAMRADREGGYFHDVRVREAVYNALNIKELIDRVELGDGEMTGPVSARMTRWAM